MHRGCGCDCSSGCFSCCDCSRGCFSGSDCGGRNSDDVLEYFLFQDIYI